MNQYIICMCRESHLLAISHPKHTVENNRGPKICRPNFLSEKEKIIFAIETTAAIMQALCRSIKDRKICGPAEISCLRARTCFVRDIRTPEAAFSFGFAFQENVTRLVQGTWYTIHVRTLARIDFVEFGCYLYACRNLTNAVTLYL